MGRGTEKKNLAPKSGLFETFGGRDPCDGSVVPSPDEHLGSAVGESSTTLGWGAVLARRPTLLHESKKGCNRSGATIVPSPPD